MSNLQKTNPLPVSDSLPMDIIGKINHMYEMMLSQKRDAEIQSLQESSETFLNVPEVSKLSHYTEQTIRTKVMLNEIPSFKMNGRRLFRKSDIMKWISNGGKK